MVNNDISREMVLLREVCILGQGNVAVDCARILVGNEARFAETDICRHAQDLLKYQSLIPIGIFTVFYVQLN